MSIMTMECENGNLIIKTTDGHTHIYYEILWLLDPREISDFLKDKTWWSEDYLKALGTIFLGWINEVPNQQKIFIY